VAFLLRTIGFRKDAFFMKRLFGFLACAMAVATGVISAQNKAAAPAAAPVAKPVVPAPAAPVPPPAPAVAPAVPEETKQLLEKKNKQRKASDDFFLGPVVHLEFKFKPEEWEYLKRDQRRYAEAMLIETAPDGTKTTYENVAVKLKGAAGSFQGPDQKPGLTINFDKYKGATRFHGMDKIHLNNGAQDGSLLNEYISGSMCRAAGVPASRCTHVIVKWQGRDTGLYLVKESFTKDFLSYFYEMNKGSLYDGHFISEVDGNLEKQQGDPADTKDLKELAAACKEGDPKARWQKVYARLDVDEYLRFLAMETFLCHWDGYNFNRNNYRVYFDPKTGKANFFCHGMDQVYGDAGWQVMRDPGSLVGQAVWSNPDWKVHYKKLAEQIYLRVLKPRDWEAEIFAQGKKVQEALAKINPQWGKEYQGQINAARDRVMGRLTSIGKQFGDMPKPFDWQGNIAKLGVKNWRSEGGGAFAEVVMDGQKCFHIRADASASASWRRSVNLEPGKYRFEAQVKVANVDGPGDSSGVGAGLRISGAARTGANGLKGSSQWQKLAYEFDATGADVMLVAELRAPKGEVWFQAESLQLVKVK
jgi:spore coat protein H